MSKLLCRPIKRAYAMKVADVPRETAVRFYCEQWKQSWALQVRAPVRLKNRAEGKDFVIAHALLSVEDLRALRAAIDAAITESVAEDPEKVFRREGADDG